MSRTPPEKIANIGPKTQAQLRQIGIRTIEDLAKLGAIDAFVRLKRAGFKPSLNALYSFEGALTGRHWTKLSPDEKLHLVGEATTRIDAFQKAKKVVMPVRDVEVPRSDDDPVDAPTADSEGYDDGPTFERGESA